MDINAQINFKTELAELLNSILRLSFAKVSLKTILTKMLYLLTSKKCFGLDPKGAIFISEPYQNNFFLSAKLGIESLKVNSALEDVLSDKLSLEGAFSLPIRSKSDLVGIVWLFQDQAMEGCHNIKKGLSQLFTSLAAVIRHKQAYDKLVQENKLIQEELKSLSLEFLKVNEELLAEIKRVRHFKELMPTGDRLAPFSRLDKH